ncbi:flagellar hook associated protein lafW [Yersinia pekkanenii]|uniref:Flagellar hook associated protein lafW n=1 Tax=Yersinia pekkanenii TaxID=1288385 RepID=A0A0T9P452_9GAMM|nr:flagellar hook associated protein lafW [Yersinia pekkanenii]
MRDIAEHPLTANKHRVGIQQAMDHITEQMSKLSEHKRNINLQINSMSSFPVPHSAQMAAEVLASKLAQGQYAMWANILVVQGSGRNSMVRNLLES